MSTILYTARFRTIFSHHLTPSIHLDRRLGWSRGLTHDVTLYFRKLNLIFFKEYFFVWYFIIKRLRNTVEPIPITLLSRKCTTIVTIINLRAIHRSETSFRSWFDSQFTVTVQFTFNGSVFFVILDYSDLTFENVATFG